MVLSGQPAEGLTVSVVFRYVTAESSTPVAVNNFGAIPFPAIAPGSSTVATLLAENTGTIPWTINNVNLQARQFAVVPPSTTPVAPGGVTVFTIRFQPTAVGAVTSSLSFEVVGEGLRVSCAFELRATAQAPDFVISYLANPTGNQVLAQDGQQIEYQPTLVGQSSASTFIVVNRGNGAGSLVSVRVSGSRFRLSGLPVLPAQVAPEKEIRFTATFVPDERGLVQETLRLELSTGVWTFLLRGEGTAPGFEFESSAGGQSQPLRAGATFDLGSIAVAQTLQANVLVRNTGNAEGRITTINISGSGYRLVDAPPLPATLAPGSSLGFSFAFTPPAAGVHRATLRIDSTLFEIAGTGLGSKLTVSSILGDLVTRIASRGTINFQNTMVGSRSGIRISINNEGNLQGSITSISASGTAFSISGMPTLPVALGPSDSIDLRLEFAPEALGNLTGTLFLDEESYSLRGAGVAPPALPGVLFTNVPSTGQPLEQPSVGVRLEQPYPLDLTGRLTLSFTPDSFVDDPAIQFASGGRTVDYRIPAGAVDANFGSMGTKASFQVGTVAGAIQISTTITVGSVNLTSERPPQHTLLVRAAPPVLRSAQIGNRAATRFEIVVNGYSTTRSIESLTLTFAPTAGGRLDTSTLTANVEPAFSAWYQGASSKVYGGQFTATIAVNVTGKLDDVDSVTVTAFNQAGSSGTVTVSLR